MRSGPIRFVGGPLHNRHLAAHWQPRLEFYQAETPLVDPTAETPYPRIDRYTYELRELLSVVRIGGRLPTPLLYFEYHCLCDQRPHSGDDFFKPLPECAFSEFCWRLMTISNALGRAHLGLPPVAMF